MSSLTAIVPATDAPPTLESCLAAIHAADEPPEEVIVVEDGLLPGDARNDGARSASGEVLVFVDADVLPHRDAFSRIRRAFAERDDLAGLFGSYDDAPPSPGAVSGFRNLLHHHVHQVSAGPATTFWTGLGAVRAEVFRAIGGFEPGRAGMEDVELGTRLAGSGVVELDPALQGTHLKAWTLREMIRTDFALRGVPWVVLLLQRRAHAGGLNLGRRHRLSAAASVLLLVALAQRRPAVAAASLGALLALNASFYALLARRRGPVQAAAGVGLHALHHLTGVVAVPAGLLSYLDDLLRTGSPTSSPSKNSPTTSSPSSRYSASVFTDQTS